MSDAGYNKYHGQKMGAYSPGVIQGFGGNGEDNRGSNKSW